jgi:hypothetical protein
MSQPALIAALGELRGKVLGCWCKPALCHGDVLAEFADAVTAKPKKAKSAARRKRKQA